MNPVYNPSISQPPSPLDDVEETSKRVATDNVITTVANETYQYNWDSIPFELQEKIFTYLEPKELLLDAARISKVWAFVTNNFKDPNSELTKNQGYWEPHTKKKFGSESLVTKGDKTNWFEIYKNLTLVKTNIKNQNFTVVLIEETEVWSLYKFGEDIAFTTNEHVYIYKSNDPDQDPTLKFDLETPTTIRSVAFSNGVVAALDEESKIYIWDLNPKNNPADVEEEEEVARPRPVIIVENGEDEIINEGVGELILHNNILVYYHDFPDLNVVYLMPLDLTNVPKVLEFNGTALPTPDGIDFLHPRKGESFMVGDSSDVDRFVYDFTTGKLITHNARENFRFDDEFFESGVIWVETNETSYSFSMFDSRTRTIRVFEELLPDDGTPKSFFVHGSKIFIFESSKIAYVLNLDTFEHVPFNSTHLPDNVDERSRHFPRLFHGIVEFENVLVDLETGIYTAKDPKKKIKFDGDQDTIGIGSRLFYQDQSQHELSFLDYYPDQDS